MKKIPITYIISGINRAAEFEWVYERLSPEYDMSFVIVGVSKNIFMVDYLNEKKANYSFISYSGKRHFPVALVRICFLLLKKRPGILHAHLVEAGVIGLLAGTLMGIRTRIYTRHHSDYHLRYHPSAVKYDKLCNRLAKKIVAVSTNVAQILIREEHVPPGKIEIIPHGFDWSSFKNYSNEKVTNLKSKYEIHDHHPVIGVVARFTHWKGVQYIIPAFSQILKKYPDACLVLANAQGEYKETIVNMLAKISKNNYRLIEFENEVAELFMLFDVFVHVPIYKNAEAFGQVYLEALASKIPSVFTSSGIASEVIRDSQHALIVPYENEQEITKAVERIIEDPQLRNTIITKGYELAMEFSIDKKINALRSLYKSLLNSKTHLQGTN